MKVAVIQPSYIPWLGYFNMIKWADIFIFYDDVQYDNNGWRNRNKILVNNKEKWLTLSIDRKSLSNNLKERRLNKVQLTSRDQFRNHKRLLEIYYQKSKNLYILEKLYFDELNNISSLSESVIMHTSKICEFLNINTKLIKSSDLAFPESKYEFLEDPCQKRNNKLLWLLKKVGCKEYISGISAKEYLDLELFKSQSINVHWNQYIEHFPDPHMSIIHYLLKHGKEEVIRYQEGFFIDI